MLRCQWWLRHPAVQTLPGVSARGWMAVSPGGSLETPRPVSSPLVFRVSAGLGWRDMAPMVDTGVVWSAESPGAAKGLLRVPAAARVGQRPWHPARGGAGIPPCPWSRGPAAARGTGISPELLVLRQAERRPPAPGGTRGAKEASQLPGHASAEAAQPPPAHCAGPAQLVLGSPGWGELALAPQSRISCMGRVSRHCPSPQLNPSLPAAAGAWRRYRRGSPAQLPVQGLQGGQRRGAGPACRTQLLVAMPRRGRVSW